MARRQEATEEVCRPSDPPSPPDFAPPRPKSRPASSAPSSSAVPDAIDVASVPEGMVLVRPSVAPEFHRSKDMARLFQSVANVIDPLRSAPCVAAPIQILSRPPGLALPSHLRASPAFAKFTRPAPGLAVLRGGALRMRTAAREGTAPARCAFKLCQASSAHSHRWVARQRRDSGLK